MLKLCVFVCLVGALCAVPVKYKDCGSKAGLAHLLDISPCPQQPCTLKIGTNVTVKIDFLSKKATKAVSIYADGTDDQGEDVEVDLDDTNACDQGVTCPVKAGDHNVFTLNYNVDPAANEMGLTLKLELLDDNNDDIVCLQVPLKLVYSLEPQEGVELQDTVLRFRPRP